MRAIGPKSEERIQRLRRQLKELPPEQKRVLAEATRWCSQSLGESGGPRCLVGHLGYDSFKVNSRMPTEEESSMMTDFDCLSSRLGLAATVALVKDAVGALK